MIDELRTAILELLEGRHLSTETMRTAVGAIMDGRSTEVEIASLLNLAKMGVLPVGPAFPQWAYEHAEKLISDNLRAGVAIDQALVRKLMQSALDRASLRWTEQSEGKLLMAQSGEVRWPVEIPIVSMGAGHLGWFLGETVGAAVGEAVGRIADIQRFLQAARVERPDLNFEVAGKRGSQVLFFDKNIEAPAATVRGSHRCSSRPEIAFRRWMFQVTSG